MNSGYTKRQKVVIVVLYQTFSPRFQEQTKENPQSVRISKKPVNFTDTLRERNKCNDFSVRARLDTEDKHLY